MYAYPIYFPSARYARENEEIDLWRESYKINIECRDFINEKASPAYHDHALPSFIKELTDNFGLERSMYVVGRFVVAADWDGRYGRDVKAWAGQIDFQDMENRELHLYSNVHPCILDAVFRNLMRIEQAQVNLPTSDLPHEIEHDEGAEQ